MTIIQKAAAALIVLAILALAGFGLHHFGYSEGHAAAVDERAASDGVAVLHRVAENVVTAATQASTNIIITKAKNEDLAPVRTRIVTERVRVGTAICGPAATPEANDAASSDSANPSSRLVRADVERDIVALKLAVEEDLATGRSCQAWGVKNGLVP